MPKQTRSQRKARRRQQAEAAAQPQRSRAAAVRPAPAEEPRAAPERQRGGFRRFVAESVAELQKVEWPGQKQVITGTVVVLIACAIVGTYLWVADLVLKRLVQNVFLGQ
jgi:preprotein translocase subunit SecE